jgi:L-asparaginase II
MHTLPAAEPVPQQYGHVPLVEATRGALVESVHYGSFTVVDTTGATILSAGVPEVPVYARSSLKPLQLTAMVRAGLELPDDLLALGTASHSGSAVHQSGVLRILAAHGLDETALRNVTDLPVGVAEREAWLRDGGVPTQLAQNCSGKHAAMVSTCVINGWTVDDYLSPAHPLQRHIEATLTELTGEKCVTTTVDGCGTPLYAYSLNGLARAFARLAAASPDSPEGHVVAAIRRYPEMVAGEGRDVVTLMRAVPGLFAKEGAEAVQLAGLADGTGIAVKISDGGQRARLPITVEILAALGVDSGILVGLASPPPLGGGRPVGELRASREIVSYLSGR